MLPYLKKTKESSTTAPADKIRMETKDEDSGDFDFLESVAHDLLEAFESKDAKGIAQALRSAFEICDAEPHEEGSHE